MKAHVLMLSRSVAYAMHAYVSVSGGMCVIPVGLLVRNRHRVGLCSGVYWRYAGGGRGSALLTLDTLGAHGRVHGLDAGVISG